MKKIFSFLAAILLTATVWAQSPEKMSYQAVIRDASDNLVTNQTVGMQISILQGSASGTAVYVETHSPTTNANGLVSIEIGTGTALNGGFTTIDWANGPYFIKTETDPSGGTSYSITGTSQLLSVPYALHAKTADTLTGTISENDPVFDSSVASDITGADTINWNNKLDNEVDGSVTNEIQILSISNDTIYLTDGGFVELPAGFDGDFNSLTNVPVNLDTDTTDDFDGAYSSLTGAPTNISTFTNDAGYLDTEVDGSVTNEIQILSISNDTIYLTDGGFVELPAGFDGQYSSLTGAPTNISTFTNDAGYLTTEVDGDVSNELQVLSISNDTIYLTDGGFVKLPTGFDGDFNSLSNVPANLDTDATDDFNGDYNSLTNTPDLSIYSTTDTTLDESEVDAMVANNGYAMQTGLNDTASNIRGDLAAVATSGDYSDLINAPDLSDTANYAEQSALEDTASSLRNDLAPKNNVLALDNTTAFTPDADYEPATKKYVDDNAGGSSHYVGELYGGGIVFYVDETGDHGLIVSLTDINFGLPFGQYGTDVGANSTWNGLNNSDILDNGAASGDAVLVAKSHTGGGNNDWYLPAIDELNMLYNARFRVNKALSNISGAHQISPGNAIHYWSSTELTLFHAMKFSFHDGSASIESKTNGHQIRAVRAF